MLVAVAVVLQLVGSALPARATHPCASPPPGGPPSDCSHTYRQPPPAEPTRVVTAADDGATVRLTAGQRLRVELVPTRPGDVWQGLDRSTGLLLLTDSSASNTGTVATFDAAGVPSYVQSVTPRRDGPYVLAARTDAECAHAELACDRTPQTWRLTVYVDISANPAQRQPAPCEPTGTPPAGLELTQYAGGRVVAASGTVLTVRGGCRYRPRHVPQASGDVLFRSSAGRASGSPRGGVFRAVRPGEATVEFAEDPACPYDGSPSPCPTYAFPTTPGSTDVRVVDASGCVEPLRATAASLLAGGRVGLSTRATPGAAVEVWFRSGPTAPFTLRRTLTAGADGSVATSFVAADDTAYYATSGSCTTPVAQTDVWPLISGPARVTRGDTVTLTVRAARGGPLTVFFRRAGEQVFRGRRYGFVGPSGLVRFTYRADADYRYYARYDRITQPEDGGNSLVASRYGNTGLTQAR